MTAVDGRSTAVSSDRVDTEQNDFDRPGSDGPVASGRVGLTLANAVGAVLALVAFLVGSEAITDNSFLTHLTTGRLILDRGSVPTTDPYSITAPGGPWTVQSWLASVLYAWLADGLGPSALRVVHGAAGAVVMGGVWRLVAPARELVPRVALAVIPLAIGVSLWSSRPLMFGLIGIVVVLLVGQSMAPPWVLVPTMWFWVNSHGSFPLAFALIGAMLVGRVIDERRVPTHELRTLAWTVGGALVAAVNPLGPRILWFPLHLLGRREALEEVVEWEAPGFDNPAELLYLAVVGLVVLAARRGAPWRSLLPAVGFLATGFLAIRNINVAVIVVVAVLAPSFGGWLGSLDGSGAGPVPRLLAGVAGLGLLGTAALVAVAPDPIDLSAYPVEEVDELERRRLVASEGVDLLHREGVGNYLGFRYGTEARVFIDDRFDYFPVDLTKDHLTLVHGGDYDDVLERRDVDVVLWEADGLLSNWLRESPGWELISDGDDWIIACRVDGPVYDRCS